MSSGPAEPWDGADPGPSDLGRLVDLAVEGLAALDGSGRFTFLNGAAVQLLGAPAAELIAERSPFPVAPTTAPGSSATVLWTQPAGRRRELEYRLAGRDGHGYVVCFQDVTDIRLQQARLTAIARAASSVTESGSLPETLDAVAKEIVMTAGISAAQILAIDDPAADLRVLGMAGFGSAPQFVERLMACRRLGAQVRFLDAFRSRKAVVVPHRRASILADPVWAPLHEIMARPDWDGFVAMPMIVRGRPLGVVNAYYEPGEVPGPQSVTFLEAMADHAAIAVDTAALLAQTRAQAESGERRRLARDLHDSVVQQLFSMRMQAEALRGQLDSGTGVGGLRRSAEELAALSAGALGDLRRLVFELRPLELAERGLLDTVGDHVASVQARTGLVVDVRTGGGRIDAAVDLQEDVYRIVSEALHNVVKHADASTVEITIERSGAELVVQVSDDGSGEAVGPDPKDRATLGLVSMRERTERWGGRFAAGPRAGGGWQVRAILPLAPPADLR